MMRLLHTLLSLALATSFATAQVPSYTSPPGPRHTGTAAGCSLWAVVNAGDSCDTLSNAFGIPVSQFLAWNPAVSVDCITNFWAGYSYCVRVGPAAPSSPPAGAPIFSDGVPCQCNRYYEIGAGDDCQTVSTKFGITTSQFLSWNPAVSANCGTNFWLGNWYCVGVSGAATCPTSTVSPTRTSTRPPSTVTGAPAPAGPTHSGIPCQCNQFHTVVDGDTCPSLTRFYGISRSDFLAWNPAVNSDCTVNFWRGSSYCVGVTGDPDCPSPSSSSELPVTTAVPTPASPTFPNTDCRCNAFYQLRRPDTCESLFEQFDLAPADFFTWNPEVSRNCTFNFYVGYSYCVGIGAGSPCSTDIPTSFATGMNTATDYSYVSDGTKASAGPLPTATGFPPEPLQPGTPSNCQQFYRATDVDTCMSISYLFRDQLNENLFKQWNPAVESDCAGLLVNYHYCVLAPRDPSTFPNATTQYTFDLPDPTGLPTTTWNVSEISLLQTTFSGAATPCPILAPAPTSAGCDDIEEIFSVSVSNLRAWNRGVDCATTLSPGVLYCIGDPTAPPAPLETPPPAGNPDGPQPQLEGIVLDCTKYWFVGGSDKCDMLAEIHDITPAQLLGWNPELNCTQPQSGRFICVESESEGSEPLPSSAPILSTTSSALGSSTVPSSTPSSSSSTASEAATTSSTTAPATWPTPTPTQAGMARDCSYFYLVRSGDTCWDISVAAGISLNALYSLNPGVGSSCQSLQANFYICLATSSTFPTPTTITSGSPVNPTPQPSHPQPHQEGIAPNCQRYYLVRGGDNCWDISVAIGVSLGVFQLWNPGLGPECGGLWANYYVCIGTSLPATTISSGPPLAN
ncbi:hypothetical protein QBC34DRAFT_143074 [Podospora aff. communis PSN243]|uniref:LysM domain-containing protein n=1 Tax=Podospora aff. communis PSN243 TaxID=3040156 RepID=A0AAV9GG14_9PEZI|nr:hypothetical protein QBC34DRAFT_143074 [Podospora aff. communis PSN243]